MRMSKGEGGDSIFQKMGGFKTGKENVGKRFKGR